MEYDRKWEYLKDWYSEGLRQDSASEMTEKLSASNKVMVAHIDNKEIAAATLGSWLCTSLNHSQDCSLMSFFAASCRCFLRRKTFVVHNQ
jgi:hypothetical protein